MRICRDPASETMDAVRAARPSFPLGSWADPALNSSFTVSCGSGEAFTMNSGLGPSLLDLLVGIANELRAGDFAISGGIGLSESVVTTRRASVKYFFAAFCKSAGARE